MSSILDHITAAVAGTIVLLALMTLQTRDRVEAVEGTVADIARQQAASTADILAQEFDNALSEPMARTALGSYRCRLVRDASNERTALVEIPAYVRTTPTGPVTPAHVQYRLQDTGRNIAVGGRTRRAYRLLREVDTGAGYRTAAVVAEGVVDFDVKFRGRASETFAGGPPLRFTQIDFQVVVAVPPPQALPGRRRTRETNSAQVGFTVRPANFATDA